MGNYRERRRTNKISRKVDEKGEEEEKEEKKKKKKNDEGITFR